MSCLDTSVLADHAAGRNTLDEALRIDEHLAECARCMRVSTRIKNARATMRAIDEMPSPLAWSSVPARLEATLRWTRVDPEPARRPWNLRWAVAVPALCVVVVVALGWARARHRWPFPDRALTHAVVAVVEPVRPPVVVVPLGAIATLVGGEVQIVGEGSAAERFDAGRPVHESDRLLTPAGGRVAFQWGEGSGAILDGNGALRLERLRDRAQELAVERGQVAVRVGPHQPGESMRVVSPDHTVTAHGTWFFVGVEPRGTLVQVVEGTVEIAGRDATEPPTRLIAPSRAFFPRGHSVGEKTRPLTGKEAAGLRDASEMGLLPWTAPEQVLASTGLLDVASEPPASLVVDGIAFGSTPLQLRRAQGRHFVELSRSGYTATRKWVYVGQEPSDMRVALQPHAVARVDAAPPAPGEVQDIVHARRSHVLGCYEHALKRNPSLSGSITLRLSVGPEGQVVTSTADQDTLYDDDVMDCLRREVAGWVFHSARNSTVVYPFVFRSP